MTGSCRSTGQTTKKPAPRQIPQRILRAVEVLAPGPEDRILEIGCGPGLAAALVCERLTAGRLLAIDRSAVAVQRTVQRNAEHVDSGLLTVTQGPLAALELPPASIDKAFAVNVNLFWVSDARQELDLLSRWLRPGGTLALLYDSEGPAVADRVVGPITRSLPGHHFDDVEVLTGDGVLGVTCRRSGRS
jgi:SAM-dependent methyltransferase